MRIVAVIVALLCCLVACSPAKTDVPKGILPIEKMQLIVWDLTRADELVTNFVLIDTSKKKEPETYKMYQQVFAIHKITKTDFYKSYSYYQQHPVLYKTLLDSVFALGTRSRDNAAKNLQRPQ